MLIPLQLQAARAYHAGRIEFQIFYWLIDSRNFDLLWYLQSHSLTNQKHRR